MEREVFYYWSNIRNGWVVYAMGAIQSTSYASVELLKQDWPNAYPCNETDVQTVTKMPLPYWLGGDREPGRISI